jgi:hypothetical protein
VRPQWRSGADVRAKPAEDSARIASWPTGSNLDAQGLSRGLGTVLRKINGNSWVQVQLSDGSEGFVRGDDVVEIWPRAHPPSSPAGKLIHQGDIIQTWKQKPSKLKERTAPSVRIRLYDAGTHYDLHFALMCAFTPCNKVQIYSIVGDKQLFQAEDVTGQWAAETMVDVYVKVPRWLVERTDGNLTACIGDAAACWPYAILSASSLATRR